MSARVESTAPWEVRAWSSHAKTTVVRANPEYVTGVEVIAECDGSGQTDIAECERRARLIAAAQDMRDACALAEAIFARQKWHPESQDPEAVALRALRAALAKGGAA